MSYRLALASIKSFSNNRLYKGFSFKIKELYNINNISHINKSKTVYSRVSKSS